MEITKLTPAQVRLNRLKGAVGLINSDTLKMSVGERTAFGRRIMREIDNITPHIEGITSRTEMILVLIHIWDFPLSIDVKITFVSELQVVLMI